MASSSKTLQSSRSNENSGRSLHKALYFVCFFPLHSVEPLLEQLLVFPYRQITTLSFYTQKRRRRRRRTRRSKIKIIYRVPAHANLNCKFMVGIASTEWREKYITNCHGFSRFNRLLLLSWRLGERIFFFSGDWPYSRKMKLGNLRKVNKGRRAFSLNYLRTTNSCSFLGNEFVIQEKDPESGCRHFLKAKKYICLYLSTEDCSLSK